MSPSIPDAFRSEVESREKRIVHLRQLRNRIDMELNDLQAEIRVLSKWADEKPSFIQDAPVENRDGPAPTEAVVEYVEKNPGTRRRALIDALEKVVASGSPNIRSVISSAISRRVSTKHLYQTKDKRLWPWDHENAVMERQAPKTMPVQPKDLTEPDDDLPF